MIQANIYKHSIGRPLNPAVSVTDDSESTVRVEIEEYVFTDEILNGLYNVLEAVRDRAVSHTGIWINGYYGSGKSHFLKYLNFCLSSSHREVALKRLMGAVRERYRPDDPGSKLEPSVTEFDDLVQWLGRAEIDSILFNIGDKVGDRSTGGTTFAKALWEEFNAFRGFNKFSIPVAQYLEKPLADKGKLADFKAALAEDGFDWDTQAETLAITELDYVLEKASEVTPLSIDVIRDQIARVGIDATPEKLSLEIGSYIRSKGDNYRLIFFIDEVSQFIGSRQELLLQLQQIVTKFSEDTGRKVWVGCTAQQDLTEILDSCHITEASDQYGKILGRFQTRVALKGTDTEYITQKRILDKDEDAVVELGRIYDEQKNALEAQFNLPTGFRKYSSKQDFIDYYPFVPYQFQLIMNVFDAFVALQYVDTEVKGNERSVLKITHKTAQDHSGDQVGQLISFDMMYSSMFEAGLKHAGQRAIKNAELIIETYPEKAFGRRVVRLLFMLCNISDPNKLLFPATLDNITTLMMTEIDQGRHALREEIIKVLDYLESNSVVRTETKENGIVVYCFLTEEESEVNSLIVSQTVTNNAMAEALKGIFAKYITVGNKESFNGNPFSVGMSIMDRFIIGNMNANLLVEFKLDSGYPTPEQFAMSNEPRKMVYYLADLYQADGNLRRDFYWYCKVLGYLRGNAANATEQRAQTNNLYRQRAGELLTSSIQPAFNRILDSCPIISGQQVIQPALLGGKKSTERYKAALTEHFRNVYLLAAFVKASETPTTVEGLKTKIRRSVGEDEYGPLNPLTGAENEIENYLTRTFGDPTVADIISHFNQAPYGWNEIATVYYLNELVRRHKRSYFYKGNKDVDKNTVAETILRDRGSYTVTAAQAIDPRLVRDFISAWKDVFNDRSGSYPNDSAELFSMCHNDNDSRMNKLSNTLERCSVDLKAAHADSLAVILDDAREFLANWKAERNHESFFRLVIDGKEQGKALIDRCKEIMSFHDTQLPLFKEIYYFVESNRDNFDFVTDEADKKLVDEIKGIYTDPRPDQTLPSYKKRRDILRGKLAEIQRGLVDAVNSAYEAAFDELEGFASENGVSFNRLLFRNTVAAKTTTSNFFALRSNTNVDSFKQAQINAILDQAARARAEQESGSGENPTVQRKAVRRIHVRPSQICRAQTIRSLEELDMYVDSIKGKLIDALGDNDEIIVS